MRTNKVDIRPKRKTFSIKKNYFKVIDSAKKAYWLGFIAADGYNNITYGRLAIALNEKDIDRLENFKKDISFTGKILSQHKIFNSVCLTIHDRDIVKDLKNLGITQRKSLSLAFPTEESVPKKLIWHYLRGYFDGDGSINKLSLQCFFCCSLKFGKSLVKFFKSCNIYSYLYRAKTFDKKYCKLRIGKQSDCLELFSHIYKNSKRIRMARKYNIYRKHLTKLSKKI